MKNFLWEDKPFSKGQAWIDLLLMANYAFQKTDSRKKDPVYLHPGEVLTTNRGLAERWGWSVNKVRRFLNTLEEKAQVEQLKTHLFTKITVRYWDKYQETDTLSTKRIQSTPKMNTATNTVTDTVTNTVISDVTANRIDSPEEIKETKEPQTNTVNGTQTDTVKPKNGPLLNNNKNNIIIIMSPDEEEVVRSLARVPGYPLDRKTDLELFHDLEKEYPKADVVEAIKSWSIAKIDKPLSKKSNPRLQIRNWLKKGFEDFGKYRKKEVIEEKPSTGKALHRDDIENFRRTYKAFLEESPNQAKGYAMRIKLTYGYDPSQEEELCQK